MAIDWDKDVLAPVMAVFGEQVIYTPKGGNPFTLSDAVFDEAYHQVELLDGAAVMSTESPAVGVRLSEFAAGIQPRKGDTVLVVRLNMVFTVKDVRPDGHGHATLMLNTRNAAS